ncbi:hypothetical protein [Bradyrhizobium sp. ARR65]|uniref:hypothetical protein n=1 Tax=Bradyrhizobium sp. ARR65 TaxID=1040989 RepID=UPI000462F5B8|nr:hypothetical protein [Bradyrhizobium sp. ARR65]
MELDGWHLTEIHIVEGILRDPFRAKAYLEQPVDMRVVDRRVSSAGLPSSYTTLFSPQIDARQYYPEMERLGFVKRVYLPEYIPFVLVEVTPMIDYFLPRASRGSDYCHCTSGTTARKQGATAEMN